MSDLHYQPNTEVDDLTLERFLESDECRDQAWDEARDRMPDHLTMTVIDWFAGTSRFDTVLEDWRDGQ